MPHISSRSPKKTGFLPTLGRRKGGAFQSLPRSLRYNVENLEPRYLLTAVPLTDPANANVAKNTASQLNSLVQNVSYLGQQATASTTLAKVAIPFLNMSVNDVSTVTSQNANSGTANPNTAADATTLGGALFGGTNDANGVLFTNAISSFFSPNPATAKTSAQLATDLQTVGQGIYGKSFTVSDVSTTGELKLDFSLVETSTTTQNIVLGQAADEFHMSLVGATDTVTTSFTANFEISADLTQTALTKASLTPADQTALDNAFGVQVSTSFEQTAVIANQTLGNFGVGFGIIGAGSPTTAGAYDDNGSLNMKADALLSFNGGSTISLNALKSASDLNTFISVTTPTNSGTDNFADLTLKIDINNPAGTSFIQGLDGVTGTFTFTDANLFDGTTPQVSAGTLTLASFARLTTGDIVSMAQSSAYFADELGATTPLQATVPDVNSVTLGDAYDYGGAVQNVFVDPLQTTENLLDAVNEPANSSNPLDYTGKTQFNIASVTTIGSASTSTSAAISFTSTATTLAALVLQLNAQLTSTANAGLGVRARLTTGQTPKIELYSTSSDTTFWIQDINPSGSGATLDLGFNGYNTVPLLSSAGANITTFTLPGVQVSSTSAIDVTKFTSPLVLTATVGTGSTSTVTTFDIPAGVYAGAADFVAAVQNALVKAGLNDGGDYDGVLVQQITVGTGFGLEFYGGNDVTSLSITGGGTVLPLSGTSTAPSFNVEVKGTDANGNATDTTQTVYVNGNLTNGLLNGEAANTKIDDLVSDIQRALIQSGVLSEDESTGINVSYSVDSSNNTSLAFYVQNPGAPGVDNTISSFQIVSNTANLNFWGLDVGTYSVPRATSSALQIPAFDNIEQFVALLNSAQAGNSNGILSSSAIFHAGDLANGISPWFTFPIHLLANSANSTSLADETGEAVSFAANYDSTTTGGGSVSNLTSASTVTISRSDDLSFTFGFNLITPATTTEALTVDATVPLLLWDGTLSGDTTSTVLINVNLDNGIVHSLTVSQAQLAAKAAADVAGNITPSPQDFVDILNADIAADSTLVGKLTVTQTTDATSGDTTLHFTSAAGVTHELTVAVPTDAGATQLVNNAAWFTLGFGPSFSSSANSAYSNGATTLTFSTLPSGLVVGDLVSNGTGIATGTLVTAINTTSKTVTLSLATTAAGAAAQTLVFAHSTNTTNSTVSTGFSSTANSAYASGATSITFTSLPTSLVVGDVFSNGTGIPTGTTVTSINTTTGVVSLSAATTAAGSAGQTLNFDKIARITANAAPGSFVLPTGAFFNVILPDGTSTVFQVDASDTSTDAGSSDLVQAINDAILGDDDLKGSSWQALAGGAGAVNLLPKLIAGVDGSGKIYLQLNPAVFKDPTQSWSLILAPSYENPLPNAASIDLELPASTTVDSSQLPNGPLSGIITNYTLSTPATFTFSINGRGPTSVTVAAGNYGSIGGLVAALNTAIGASTSIFFGPAANPNSNPFPLSDFVHAEVTAQGTRILLRLLDPGIVGSSYVLPVLENATFTPGSSSANSLTDPSQLGFATGESLIGLRGSSARIESGTVNFIGTATITAAGVTGTGNFGFVAFNFGTGSTLSETIATELQYTTSTGTSSLEDLFGAASGISTTVTLTPNLTIEGTTTVDLLLKNLSFPSDPSASAISGLAFGSGATIDIAYDLTSDTGSIYRLSTADSLATLPPPKVTFSSSTNNMQLLSSLTLNSVIEGLMRVGDLISNWMQNDPTGPFASSLLFTQKSLVAIQNFGQDFSNTVVQLANQPPTSLETTQTALANALQISPTAVSFSIITIGTGSTAQLALNISFDWVQAISETLPLSVDIASIAGRSAVPNSSDIQAFLLGLSTITSGTSDPLSVTASFISRLSVNLDIITAEGSSTVTPKAELFNPTNGDNFYESKFNLNASGLSGDLPAGPQYLQLTNGSVVIDSTGQLAGTDTNGTALIYDTAALTTFSTLPSTTVFAATTTALSATYSSTAGGTFTENGNGALSYGGVTASVGSYILVNNQGAANLSQNGIYRVTTVGDSTHAYVLVRVSTTATRFSIVNGYYAGQTFGIASPTTYGVLLAPASFRYNLSTFTNPDGTTGKVLPYTVVAASTGSIDTTPGTGVAVYDSTYNTLTAAADGSIDDLEMTAVDPISGLTVNLVGIDGQSTLNAGNLVLLKNQGDSNVNLDYQNGVYVVTTVGDSSTKWVLTRADFATTGDQLNELRISVALGLYNSGTNWVETTASLSGALSAGVKVEFGDTVSDVYADYHTVGGVPTRTPWLTFSSTGAANANLPLAIEVVNNDGTTTIINRDLGTMTDTQKTAFAAEGAGIVNDANYTSAPLFPPLVISIASLQAYFVPGSTGTAIFSTTANPLPKLSDSVLAINVLDTLKNAFYVGDAVDLALFAIQEGIDQALAIDFPLVGTKLASYADFVEEFRDTLTTDIRANILQDPREPINAIVDALYSALGPTGAGYFTQISDIHVHVLTSSGSDTNWDITNHAAGTTSYKTVNGVEYEQVAGTATSITFSFQLSLAFNSSTAVNIPTIDLGDTTLGATVSTQTEANSTYQNGSTTITAGSATTGGINLQRSFLMNLGLGFDYTDGFYVFNPTTVTATAVGIAGGANQDFINFGFKAELDGDINTPGIQPFLQTGYVSQWNQLSVELSDGRLLDYINNPADPTADGLPSGLYGNVVFDLDHHLATGNSIATLGFLNAKFADLNDLRSAQELGPDILPGTVIPTGESQGLLNFSINADSDIQLMMETESQGLIPSFEADFIYDKRYGTGAGAAFGLVFNNATLVGLGDSGIGTDALNAFAGLDDDTVTSESGESSPTWRFNRNQLTDNGAEGSSFVAYQNISVDVEDYLGSIVYPALKGYEETIGPIRPYLKFLADPLPGTSWMPSPLSIGMLLGAKFNLFLQTVLAIDNEIAPLAELAASASSTAGWTHARATLGGSSTISFDTSKKMSLDDLVNSGLKKGNNARFDKYKAARDATYDAQDNRTLLNQLPPGDPFDTTGASSNSLDDQKSSLSKLTSALNEAATTPNKFARNFEKFRDNGYLSTIAKPTSIKDKLKNAVTKSVKDALDQNDSRGGKKAFGVSLSGGAFYLDALTTTSLVSILQGNNANLLRVEFPTVTGTFTYTREFPLPAFPPLCLKIAFEVQITLDFNFGWDTQGFYWNTKSLTQVDSSGNPATEPLFGLQFKVSVGAELNFGLVDIGIDFYIEIGVNFFWNDVAGTGKLHQSDIDYLNSQGDSLMYAELYGKIGVTIYVDISIPIPLIGPINIELFRYTKELTLFDFTIGKVTGEIQLATLVDSTDGILRLNSGIYASQRLFVDTDDRNETFDVYRISGDQTTGENVLVEFDGYYDYFTGIKQIIGYGGRGQSVLDAGTDGGTVAQIVTANGVTLNNVHLQALQYAVVDFYGGAGNTVLRAGASYYSGWGRSRLVGGVGTSVLYGNVTGGTQSVGLDLIGGNSQTIIYGSTGSDNIVSGAGNDILYGDNLSTSTSGDNFYFSDNFGQDRIYATGSGNSVSFNGIVFAGSSHEPLLVPTLAVAAATNSIKFQFGPLVEDAVSGSNFVFFATDPAGVNQIDNWTGGQGNDQYNVFYFAPDQTLHLWDHGGNNLYHVYLGDPNERFFSDIAGSMAPANYGYVDITDYTNNGALTLTGTTSNPLIYTSTSVNNGREQMTLVGIKEIDPETTSTIYWGDPNNTSTYTATPGGTVIGGNLVLYGNVELTGNTVLELQDTLHLIYNINLVGTSSNPASLEIDVVNPSAAATSDIDFETNNNSPAGSPTPSQILISQTSVKGTTNTPAGDGFGTIYLYVPTGSLINISNTTEDEIVASNARLAISARDTIGTIGTATINAKIDIDVNNVAATVTGASTSSNTNSTGIYLYSDQDLQIQAYQGIIGLSTTHGSIDVQLAAGRTLSYYQLNAGGGGNITLIADHIQITPDFTTIQETLLPVYTQYVITTIQFVPVAIFLPVQIFFFYTYFTPFYFLLPEIVNTTITVTTYATGLGPVSISTGNSAQITGSEGTTVLTLLNATSGSAIQVGGGTPPSNGLFLSDAILATIKSSVVEIDIGRKNNDPITTGTITMLAHTFTIGDLEVYGSQIDIKGSLTVDGLLHLYTYGSASNDTVIFFTPTSGVYTFEADSIKIETAHAVTLHGDFVSTDPTQAVVTSANFSNGAITVSTAAGDITVASDASLLASVLGSGSFITLTAAQDVEIYSTSIVADGLLALAATSGEIDNRSNTAIKATQLSLKAALAINLQTDASELLLAQTTGTSATSTITLSNLHALTIHGGTTADGVSTVAADISITAGGDLTLKRDVGANSSNPIINTNRSGTTPGTHTVTLDSTSGQIQDSGSDYSNNQFDVRSGTLIADSDGDISLITNVSHLTAIASKPTSGSNDISLENAGDIVLTDVESNGGTINIGTDSSITVTKVTTTGSGNSALSSISLANTLGALYDSITLTGTIDAGLANVFVGSDNAILGTTGNDLIRGNDVTLDALSHALPASTVISAFLEATSVDTFVGPGLSAGDIYLTTDQTLVLHDVENALGDIHVTSQLPTGSTGVGPILYTDDVDAGLNVYLTSAGRITTVTPALATSLGLAPLVTGHVAKIQGAYLTTRSVGDTLLNTSIGTLDALVQGTIAGSLTVDETDGIDLYQAKTYSGDIIVNAGQAGAVTNFSGATIKIGLVTAGSGLTTTGDDVYLNSLQSYIVNETPGVGEQSNPLLTANNFYANYAPNPLNAIDSDGIHGLNTAITNLYADATEPGAYITINELDNIDIKNVVMVDGAFTLTAGDSINVENLTTTQDSSTRTDGLITLTATTGAITQTTGKITGNILNATAYTGITSLTAINDLMASINSTSGDITITEDDNIVIDTVLTPSGKFKLTAGGRVDAYTGTTNQVTATQVEIDTTTGIGQSTNYLNILADQLDATATVSGGIYVNNRRSSHTGSTYFLLDSVIATNGPIAITSAGNMRALNVESTHDLALNDISLTTSAGGNLLIDFVVAGKDGATAGTTAPSHSNVYLTAAGLVLGQTSVNQVIGDDVTVYANGPAVSATADAISLFLEASHVEAFVNNGTGAIDLTTDQNLVLHDLQTSAGEIHVSSHQLSGLTGPAPILYTGDINAPAHDIYLTSQGQILKYNPTLDSVALPIYKIQGVTLYSQSVGDTLLDTLVTNLDAAVTGTGTLTVTEKDDLNIYRATTTNGTINITAGELHPGADVTGNLYIGTLTAGSGLSTGSDVYLQSIDGEIQDEASSQYEAIAGAGYAPLLSGATLYANYNTNDSHGIHGLTTAITTLDTDTTFADSYVVINELNDINIDHAIMSGGGDFTLTAGGFIDVVNLLQTSQVAGDGLVTLTSTGSVIKHELGKIIADTLHAYAASGISANTAINEVAGFITGSAGDITLNEDDNINIDQIVTPSGKFSLFAGGMVDPLSTTVLPIYNVVANDIEIHTLTGIATPGQYLDVYGDTLDADATTSGGIYIHNFKNHTGSNSFILQPVVVSDGSIDIISMGNMTAVDVEGLTDSTLNNTTLQTTDGGNLLVNFVGVGLNHATPGVHAPLLSDVTLISDGSINAITPTSSNLKAANVVGYDISLEAQTGIGNIQSLLLTGRLLTASTNTGDMSLGNDSADDFSINGFSTNDGNLSFLQLGGGSLYANGFRTGLGNISLGTGDSGFLYLDQLSAVGNVTLYADQIEFNGGANSITGTGILYIHPYLTSIYTEINSFVEGTPYEKANTLEIGKIAFFAFQTDFKTILIGNQSNHNLTYAYFDLAEEYPSFGEVNEGATFLPGSDTPTDFRLFDVFSTRSNGITPDQEEMEEILSTQLNVDEGSFDISSFEDTSEDTAYGPTSSNTLVAEAPSSVVPVVKDTAHHAAARHEHSWIDATVASTAAISAMGARRRPVWLKKLSQLWSR